MKVFDDRNNTQTVTVKNGETFKIELIENPTTGYSWNISTTPGLTIINDTFIPPSGDVMGAAGMHEWQVKATGTGDQQFTGVYKRPWEPSFGNESVYSLNVKIA
jgi:inhibitor of cysteine peptidase